MQLELASDQKVELEEQILSLQDRNKHLIISKIQLCTTTSEEMSRMSKIIRYGEKPRMSKMPDEKHPATVG